MEKGVMLKKIWKVKIKWLLTLHDKRLSDDSVMER